MGMKSLKDTQESLNQVREAFQLLSTNSKWWVVIVMAILCLLSGYTARQLYTPDERTALSFAAHCKEIEGEVVWLKGLDIDANCRPSE